MHRKFDTHYMTVAVKRSSAKGARRIVDHIFRDRARDGIVETNLAPDEHRTVEFMTGGVAFNHVQVGKTAADVDPKLIADIIDINFRGGKQSKFTHKSIVLSVGDPIDYELAQKQTKEAAIQYVAEYFPNCPAWVIAIHRDKAHVHAHIVACNWDSQEQDIYNWSRPEIIRMNALRWYDGPLQPGAWLYKRSPDEKTLKAYPKGKLNILTLASMVEHNDPMASLKVFSETNDEAGNPIVRFCTTKGGHQAVEFRGQVIDIRALNFEINKQTGHMIGRDGRLYPYGTKTRSPVEQEIHFNVVAGDGVGELNRGVGYALSTVEHALLDTGTPPSNDKYRKHVARGVYGAMRSGLYEDFDLALAPFMGLLRALIGGATIKPSPLTKLLGEVLEAVMGYEKQFEKHPDFPKIKSRLLELAGYEEPSL